MANTSRYWDTGINDPNIQQIIEERFGRFKNDAIPDDEQPIQAEFEAFARRIAGMVRPSYYVVAAMSSLDQCMEYILEADVVAKENES